MSTPSLADRGFQYGDGLFETIRIENGALINFDGHWLRLKRGAEVLDIRLPAKRMLQNRCQSQAAAIARGVGVLKLQLTRGDSAGGYASPEGLPPNVYLSLRPLALPLQRWQQGIALRWCQQTLAIQPALAGIKHCNRLEQVLARREWAQDFEEGLMCDTEGFVVEGTASNLFVYLDDEWHTPLIDRCGVAGTQRQQILDWFAVNNVICQESRITRAEVSAAEHIFMTNALIGLWPVASLEGEPRRLSPLMPELLERFSPMALIAKQSVNEVSE